jgi:hypothetical protein
MLDYHTSHLQLTCGVLCHAVLCCAVPRYIVGSAAIQGPSPAALRGPPSLRDFYNGFSVIMSAFGGHAMAL